jgi:chitin disaccharide deacetylase
MSANPTRRIWLCADDYGIAPGVNAAIRHLIARRRINATSVMVVAPSFSKNEAEALRETASGQAAIGLHLTLTAPFKPLSKSYAPRRNGAFLPLGRTMLRAYARALSPGRLRNEIARQVEAFVAAFGRPPDFIDGHQHVQLLPQIAEAVLDVVENAAPWAWIRQCERALPWQRRFDDAKALFIDTLSLRFRRLAARRRVRTNAGFAGAYAFRAATDYGALFPRFLDDLPDGGVVMCHPGTVDAALRNLDPLTALREREYAYLLGPDFPRLLTARGYALA